MLIKEIYKKYLLPRNLQEHMLRVAALSQIILEIWKAERLDKNAVITTCLFHDIAKPLTFEPEKQAKYGATPEEIENIKKFQIDIRRQFGNEEHTATISIMRAEKASDKAIEIMSEFEWTRMKKLLKEKNTSALIVLYCDMRIGPNGILPLRERLENLKTRYSKYMDHDTFLSCGLKVEKIIMDHVTLDLESISNAELHSRFDALLEGNIGDHVQ